MKKIFLLFILSGSFVLIQAQEAGLEQKAEEAYKSGQYAQAEELYKQLLDEKGESAEVYYNLGNTYYKMNNIGPAILNYERCLMLDPSDKDAQFNLEMARAKNVDTVNVTETFLLKRWLDDTKNLFSERGWGIAAICFFFLFLASLFLFFFGRRIILKKIGFYVGLSTLFLSIVSNSFAYSQREKQELRDQAIIMAATVTIKSSPDKSGTDLFVLHEGTKVKVRSALSNWSEIELPDGTVGWIENNKLERI
ncbi:MAG: tetratricopeptide repeat protein [Bacteroidales bacterium]|nr:tetratricopeptide repeat protein [Bacteroidales bacterium]